ncbi:MAG: serine/threonine protein kinase [Campylobacteraceae bacterium]|nr:serine/threonine protein kinase [Campylobacteraceae bacterium]
MNIDCFQKLGLNDIRLIKDAGQKIVYSACLDNGTKVALKIIKPDQDIERIKREIEILKRCCAMGINTATIYSYDVVTCENMEYFYIVEYFIEGTTLKDYILANAPIDCKEVISFLNNMFAILHILKQEQLIHRDIKPENIIRDGSGKYFLIDFGITKDLQQMSLTNTSDAFGPCTIGYAPVEQMYNKKDDIGNHTDLFSIGVIAYEMLSGENPFISEDDERINVMRKIEKGNYKKIKTHQYEGLNQLIYACMNKHISRRPDVNLAIQLLLEIEKEVK